MAQQVSSAASLSTPVNEPVFARLHVHLNYRAQKKAGVCLSRGAKSILMKETVGRAWDFNHGDTEPPTSFTNACNIRAASDRRQNTDLQLVPYRKWTSRKSAKYKSHILCDF